jgi:gluconate kinase
MQSRDFREEFSAIVGDGWDMHWLQAVESLCGMVDGLPSDDPDRSKWIAALGDSVVPQVIVKIMQAIKDAD